jgi:hypothetical protein
MEYVIHLAFDWTKHNMVLETINNIKNIASEYKYSNFYDIYENKMCIIVISFESCIDIIPFIQKIKKLKGTGVFIENIHKDDIECKLLYASTYHLKSIDKREMLIYKKNKRSYSEGDINIFNIS